MDTRWRQLIDGLTYVKPECIDKEKIKLTLRYDRTYDMQVIDTLFEWKVLTIDEYIEALKRLISIQKDGIKYLENYLEEAEHNKETYNPMIHYGFGMNYSEEISHKLNSRWVDATKET